MRGRSDWSGEGKGIGDTVRVGWGSKWSSAFFKSGVLGRGEGEVRVSQSSLHQLSAMMSFVGFLLVSLVVAQKLSFCDKGKPLLAPLPSCTASKHLVSIYCTDKDAGCLSG